MIRALAVAAATVVEALLTLLEDLDDHLVDLEPETDHE